MEPLHTCEIHFSLCNIYIYIVWRSFYAVFVSMCMYMSVNVCAGAAIHMYVCGPTQVSFHRKFPSFYWVRSGHWSRTKWARLWLVNHQNNACTLFPPYHCWGYKPVPPFMPFYVDSGPQIHSSGLWGRGRWLTEPPPQPPFYEGFVIFHAWNNASELCENFTLW